MRDRKGIASMIVTAALVAAGAAWSAMATETVNYTYDARGRLIKVERSGTINNGVVANYTIDKTENRTNVKVTGVP
jgi:hypothetical protein